MIVVAVTVGDKDTTTEGADERVSDGPEEGGADVANAVGAAVGDDCRLTVGVDVTKASTGLDGTVNLVGPAVGCCKANVGAGSELGGVAAAIGAVVGATKSAFVPV